MCYTSMPMRMFQWELGLLASMWTILMIEDFVVGLHLGYNGSLIWDTSFAVQAFLSTELTEEYGPTLRKAHMYIKNSQVVDDCPGDLDYWYRHISKGAWPFSTADQG